MSGFSCVPENIGAVRPLKTCIFRGFGAQKTISSYSFDRIVLIFTARRNARIASAVLATAIPSVRPSVRHTPVLCQNDGT